MAPTFEVNLPMLDSKSEPPALFDGTARLYINTFCPYAQRVWSARNFKGLENIELVNISLSDKPSWFVEKVYPIGKVPALEHNGKVTGESLNLLEYLDKNFGGPALFPMGSAKEAATKDLLNYIDEVNKAGFGVLKNKEATREYVEETLGSVLDYLEASLGKFSDEGRYFLGQISAVDFAYAPFLERLELLSADLLNYDILEGRPRLMEWFKAINEVDAYTSTKNEPKILSDRLKKHLGR